MKLYEFSFVFVTFACVTSFFDSCQSIKISNFHIIFIRVLIANMVLTPVKLSKSCEHSNFLTNVLFYDSDTLVYGPNMATTTHVSDYFGLSTHFMQLSKYLITSFKNFFDHRSQNRFFHKSFSIKPVPQFFLTLFGFVFFGLGTKVV